MKKKQSALMQLWEMVQVFFWIFMLAYVASSMHR